MAGANAISPALTSERLAHGKDSSMPWLERPLFRYSAAALLAFVALGLRLFFFTHLTSKGPYLTFFLATIASAGLLGVGPAVVTALLGLVLAGTTLPSDGWLHVTDPSDPVAVV